MDDARIEKRIDQLEAYVAARNDRRKKKWEIDKKKDSKVQESNMEHEAGR